MTQKTLYIELLIKTHKFHSFVMLSLTLHHFFFFLRYAKILILTYGIDYFLSLGQNTNSEFQFRRQKILPVQLIGTPIVLFVCVQMV